MKAWTSSTDTSAVKTYREARVESNVFCKFARSEICFLAIGLLSLKA
jgi:hypothetical protein